MPIKTARIIKLTSLQQLEYEIDPTIVPHFFVLLFDDPLDDRSASI